ncbi:hypothetical protein D3C85_1550050 [compost metagenome]
MRGLVEGGDRHAGAVERNAVAQADIVEVARRGFNDQALAMGGGVAKRLHGGNAPHAGDDSSKHVLDCGSRKETVLRLRDGRRTGRARAGRDPHG